MIALVISVQVPALAPAVAQGSVTGDREALVALYDSTDGDNWRIKTNWKSDMPLGTWRGVTTNSNGRVIVLTLGQNLLTGMLPAKLGDLSALTMMGLGSNTRLTGPIPPELGNLSNLTELDLVDAQLTGSIPSELFNLSKLTRLDLSNSQLTGAIPAELGRLSNLTHLDLGFAQFTGPIPPELGNLSELTQLSLNTNQLSGPIPPELGNFSKLTELRLDANQLTGPVPPELGDLGDTLTTLSLSGTNNRLTGCVPFSLRNAVSGDTALALPVCPPKVILVLSPPNVAENGGTTTVTATLEGRLDVDVMLTVSVAPVPPAVSRDISLSGSTLTIAAGQTSSTGVVTITAKDNDAIAPNGAATVLVSATDSDMVTTPQPAILVITDDDGIMKRDGGRILAGTARSMASDTVDMLTGRFDSAPASSDSQVTLAGHALRLTPQSVRESGADAWRRIPVRGEFPWPGDRQRTTPTLSAQDPLTRSSFVLALDKEEGDKGASDLTLWGRTSVNGFSASPETGLDMNGALTSGWLGLDYRVQSVLVGLAVTHGTGSVEYGRTGGLRAEADMTLTRLTPYAQLQVEPGLELWAMLGAGHGEMAVTLAGASAVQTTDLTSFMGAVGGRQALTRWDSIDLDARADVFVSTLHSEGTAGLPEATGGAQRVRLLVEGSTLSREDADTRMVPRFSLGGRWDSGTDASGVGLEVGGGFAWTQTEMGLRIDLQGRYLLARSKDGFEDWGASLDLRFDPGAEGQGLRLGLSPVLGDAASGAEHIYGGADMTRLAANDNRRTDRLDAELAYGVAGRDGAGTITPYGGLTLDRADATRYRLGNRLMLGSSLDLTVEGSRTELTGVPASHGISAKLGLRW